MVACVRKVVELHGREFSERMWLVAPLDLQTLAVSVVACVRKVVELHGREFSERMWLVAPLDLQFL